MIHDSRSRVNDYVIRYVRYREKMKLQRDQEIAKREHRRVIMAVAEFMKVITILIMYLIHILQIVWQIYEWPFHF